MTVKVLWADNNIEIFESDKYVISPVKNFHPGIVSVEVWNGNKRIAKKKRFFSFWYSHITFRSEKIQNELKRIIAENEKNNS